MPATGGDAPGETMQARRILVVEDEAIVSLDIQSRLKRMGYQVSGASSSGEDAVAKAQALRPDIILMDIMLEGAMDGIDAAMTIGRVLDIPVIYLTAYADEKTLERAKVTNPFGYIIKPFEDRELQTTIEMAAYKHETDRKLVNSERWLATTLKHLGEAVITTGPDGTVRYLNPVARTLLGVRADAARDRTILELFGDEGGRLASPGGHTCRVTTAGGESVPVEANVSPIIDDRGQNLGNVLVLRDISERVKNEERMREYVENLRRTMEATVTALAVTSEKRDPYTAGHQQRVAALAAAIGKELGFGEERLEALRVAGLLHDIGKIYIPAEILAKPARLTPMEMGLIKTHSEVGHEILSTIPFPWPVADMVLQHHERIDGSGYPGGLKEGEILEEAKILAVADVVEAMSSHRPYRAGLGLDRALDEVKTHAGTRYCRKAVDACVLLFDSGRFTFSQS
jgi:PAS domain S-box-containing protein/putative nucleotidyltransferase with HDIG domain